eukprot:CAMPEP_0171302010 /NCGR_PEP_ID=MMETSP0816-20121228/11292_1 /TAXON_ID=420281 /ORGANISM="Proboscia inermis, Strain CCAP1064/1" /LENGTH=161 /DNA_ID=CAMNT_0011780063 /DNA_START=494 /DNA_END=976 /DNA_ORIENTATION=+
MVEITNEEKDDADILGCDEVSWDSQIHHYSSFYWEDLINAGVKSCATKLGYDIQSWDLQLNPPSSAFTLFDDLSNNEKEGAICMGYSEFTWDFYQWGGVAYTFTWQDLKDDGLQDCAEDLGYTQNSWDTGIGLPASYAQLFNELDSDEKKGAICLGYSEST